MKRLLRTTAMLNLALLAGCADPLRPGDEPWQAVALDEAFVHGYTGFGLELFRALSRQAPQANLILSPTSAAFALAMTYNGAAGETQQAMARVLGVETMTREEVNPNNLRWLESLTAASGRVELSLANSLWIRQGFPVRPEFLERNRTYYRAQVQELDFSSPAAATTINDWVRQNTRGKIDGIVDHIPASAVTYLINALYFKGDWTHPFDRRSTHDAPFTLPDGTQRTVPMMSQTGEFPALFDERVRAVALPYGNGRFVMLLAVPAEGATLPELLAGLDTARWAEWIAGLREQRVAIALPRFELEWESSLNDALVELGMGIAFGRGETQPDFRELSPANPWIDEVKQKTYLAVDEEGTTAAAVTSVAMVESMPPEIRFDRPFFLAIYDNATRTVLFMGQVVDPS